ncbi:MAG TPA: PP2C family serine/threonine-protein phosphatase [Pirellulales bacterium]|jgi:protein phosphatase|nr:PP2C family serine/threonine-protein phosphatase [Pirellulales bacterium]
MEQTLNWSDCLAHVEMTDVGMRRANNQDSFAVLMASDVDSWRRKGHVFVVADGMGAHAAGELASKMAADGIPHNYYKLRDDPPPDAISKSIHEVNDQIHRRGQANAEFHGMGTTASVLLILPQGALVAHVGDSRVYRVRGGRIEQLTFDHSLVWEMAASGQVPRDAAPNLVPKNIITRSLGPHKEVKVDLEGPYPLEVGDTFLLCSDGLTGQVKDEEIGAVLSALSPAEAGQVLIDLANLRGGPDNITALIVRVTGAAITASGGSPQEPLALGTNSAANSPPPPNSKYWMGAIAAILASIFLPQFSWGVIPAIVCLVLGVGLITFAILQRMTPPDETKYLTPGARLGRGPHATIDCAPNEAIVGNLSQLLDQLREAAGDGQWDVDWTKFDGYAQQGRAAVQRRDFSGAIREYVHALRFMMNQLRTQGRSHGSDAAPDDVLG